MSLFVGPYLNIVEAAGPRAYEVRNGRRYLTALEGGEVRCWPEYHLILIDERTGYLTIEGGYGTFAYGWPSVARGAESLHSFLYKLHFAYFMGKAAKQPYMVADLDATITSLQRELLADRRCQYLEKREARDLWDHLEDADHDSADELVRSLYRDSGWSARLDCSDPSVMIEHPGMRRFWDEVWTPFAQEVLRPHWLQHQAKTPLPKRRALIVA